MAEPKPIGSGRLPVVIATWPFGLPASEVTWKALENGAGPLDAVIAGVSHCEDDSSVDSVGYGGLPDASGEVTLDASVVDEKGRCGAVACLRRIRHAAQVAGAGTTSGRAYKLPGRVGDSPILGAGLYVDGEVGGAAATGVGEEVIKVAGSFAIVEHMRSGATPQEAIERVLRRIEKRRGDR